MPKRPERRQHVCSTGQCAVVCNSGFNNCDLQLQNGCETFGACISPEALLYTPARAMAARRE